MIQIFICNKNQRLSLAHGNEPLELGRSDVAQDAAVKRIAIQDDYTSRNHVRLEQPSDGIIKLKNLSENRPVTLSDGRQIRANESLTLEQAVVSFSIGETKVDVECATDDERWATIAAPVNTSAEMDRTLELLPGVEIAPSLETLSRWFETLVSVQRAAAGSADFYDQAAMAIVTLIGLDEGLVLLREDGDWVVAGKCTGRPEAVTSFSRSTLQKVLVDRRTFYKAGQRSKSMADVSVAAASPIFDAPGNSIVGAVYGSRLRQSGPSPITITPVEAQLLQTLAGVISLGIARMVQETEASRLRVQFDQFFSPKLARALEGNSDLLEGRESEVTVLFSDLRGFTGLAEELEPHETCQIITDVLECLTATIFDHDGVLVDYAGDGLMAMWNAPTDQPNHAELACDTALEMIARMPDVSSKWKDRIGGALRVGIGINTGRAVVGNTGTQYKFKYGARGPTVNRASRIEGATKQLGVPLLVSGSTREQLSPRFAARRLFQVRMVGIPEPVQLYELHGGDVTGVWNQRRDIYEEALSLFEDQDWSTACQRVQPLLFEQDDGQIDLPSLILATRAIDCLKSRPEPFDPAISLAQK
jgi:adenylate cyclase